MIISKDPFTLAIEFLPSKSNEHAVFRVTLNHGHRKVYSLSGSSMDETARMVLKQGRDVYINGLSARLNEIDRELSIMRSHDNPSR